MKFIMILVSLFLARSTFAQISDANLNGKTFNGTATEITSPESDRLPIYFNDLIIFDSGKVYSTLMNKYSANESPYTSEVDGRRMIAAEVVKFNSSGSGIVDGNKVTVEFSGEVIGGTKLSGIYTIHFKDRKQFKFAVNAEAE